MKITPEQFQEALRCKQEQKAEAELAERNRPKYKYRLAIIQQSIDGIDTELSSEEISDETIVDLDAFVSSRDWIEGMSGGDAWKMLIRLFNKAGI